MGVAGAWDAIEPTQVLPLRDWCRRFLEQHQHLPVIAVDISNHIYQVSTEKKSRQEGIEHTQLARRLFAFLALGCSLVCVFDGPMIMEKRRHTPGIQAHFLRQASPMVTYARKLANALRVPSLEAKGEAEAQCAALQRYGQVDVVFTSDADVLANGATRILRYDSSGTTTTTGHFANLRVIKYYEVPTNLAPVFALQALMLGNDWAEGVSGIGRKIAFDITQPETGFAQRLAQISASGEEVELEEWRLDLSEELKANKHKWLSRRCNKPLPLTFPDLKVYRMLVSPAVHDELACAERLSSVAPQGRSDYSKVVSALKQLWFQLSPVFGGNKDAGKLKPNPDTRQLASFQAAVAPLVVAALVNNDDLELRNFVFKRVENSTVAEVVHSPTWSELYEGLESPEFFQGARVPLYLANGKRNVRYLQKPALKALRNNSTLDCFLKMRDDKPVAQPLRAARSQSSPAAFVPTTQQRAKVTSLPETSRLATDHSIRQPLLPLTSAHSNSTLSAPAATARIGKRQSSKASVSPNDTRLERYFAAVELRRSRVYPSSMQRGDAKLKNSPVREVTGLHEPQRCVVDLTSDTSVMASSDAGLGQNDSEEEEETDADDVDYSDDAGNDGEIDDTVCVQVPKPVGASAT